MAVFLDQRTPQVETEGESDAIRKVSFLPVKQMTARASIAYRLRRNAMGRREFIADVPGVVAAQIIGTVAGASLAGWLLRGAAPVSRDERHAPEEASSRLLQSAD
jgi:hypothetical protein